MYHFPKLRIFLDVNFKSMGWLKSGCLLWIIVDCYREAKVAQNIPAKKQMMSTQWQRHIYISYISGRQNEYGLVEAARSLVPQEGLRIYFEKFHRKNIFTKFIELFVMIPAVWLALRSVDY